jgi:hypothetical protein
MEMHMAKTMNILNLCHGTKSSSFATPSEQNVGPNKFTFPSIDAAVRSIPTVHSRDSRNSASLSSKHSQSAMVVTSNGNPATSSSLVLNQNYSAHNSTNADLASVDSSDTFMSCQTHPFLSQGDLTSAPELDELSNLCDFDMIDSDNMYMTSPYGHMCNKNFVRGGSLYSGPVNIIVDSSLSAQGSQVKKSTSGDTALRSLAASPIDDQYSGSRVSLNETPVPKHRKTRFQQQQQQQQQQHLLQQQNTNNLSRPKTRFDDGGGGEESGADSSTNVISTSSNSKKNRRASFMPSKIITSATKHLINQHLFGLQSMGSGNGSKGERGL